MNTEIKLNLENLTKEERNQLMNLVEKANCEKLKELWKPKQGEHYHYLYSDGDLIAANYDECFGNDGGRLSIGNCFKTEEGARFAVDRLKIIQELKELAAKNPVTEVDWNDRNIEKYVIGYNYVDKRIEVVLGYYLKYNCIYFKTIEEARNAIKIIGEDRIKKYYLGVEEQ